MADDETLLLLTLLIYFQQAIFELDEATQELESLLVQHMKEQRMLNRSLPKEKKRPPWKQFASMTSDLHFRRMFRMNKVTFECLCERICQKVGEQTFRPEDDTCLLKTAQALSHTGGPSRVKSK
jgi:hypothetical protein